MFTAKTQHRHDHPIEIAVTSSKFSDPEACAPLADTPNSVPSPAAEKRPKSRGEQAEKTAVDEIASTHFDLDAAEWYLNRELTWLEFNRRVLHEAQDGRTPLLERVKFLAIVHSNLDEFFMKRIGGLKQLVGAGVQELSVDGRTPLQQIKECHSVIHALTRTMHELSEKLLRLLEADGIHIVTYKSLSKEKRARLRDYYRSNILPLVTPLAIDPAHPFPFMSNLSLNLLVGVQVSENQQPTLVRVKVPTGGGAPRFIQADDTCRFVPLEELISDNLDLLFPGLAISFCELFRVTRNAIVESTEDNADDLLALIETELQERKFAPVVRLEVAKGMNVTHLGMLAAELGLDQKADVYEVEGFMAGRDLFQIASLDLPGLHDPPHHAIDHPAFKDVSNMFHAIRERKAVLVQHPYESFATSVERFVEEASRDPKVVAIKMTIYRTAAQSKIIDHLIEAAQNGKHIAVAVELKARFDESANIRWANYLEEAGIHVSYGVLGLKTHSKLILVVRRDYDGLRRYAHVGTGNYHAGTARIYSDLGLFTCDPLIGEDLTEIFNYLTSGQAPNRNYHKLLPAPTLLKPALLAKIKREIDKHKPGKPGLIRFKMNALEDKDITKALYQAAQAGVEVQLIIRDTCRFRPGIPGLSEHGRVVSIVGRFLEHTRIYHFRNGGEEEFFIGSADCMKRNLESRVEVVTPVEAQELRAYLNEILEIQFNNARSAWEMEADGSYRQRQPLPGQDTRGAQEILNDLASQRAASYLQSFRPTALFDLE